MCVRIPAAHIVSVSCPLKIIANQVKQNNTHTHSAKEQRSTTDTFRCNDRRLYVSRGQHFRNMCHKCDAFHKGSRQNASRRTWAGSGRRLAMDCVTREKSCLRRCHGITHKQRRMHTELPTASLFPVPLPSADTENTRKMGSRDQLCGKPHNSRLLP